MFYAYVLQSELNGLLYKGSTENLTARITQHNEGMVNYTRKYRPWKLVHYEIFQTRAEAMSREQFFKSGKGRDFLKQKLQA
jgi:putative endonuclease